MAAFSEVMGSFDRLVDGVEDLTGQTPGFEDGSDVFEADVSVMVVEDGTRYLAVPIPGALTPSTVDEILKYVDGEWSGHWQKVRA
jgi:hypothetical protein